MSDTLQVGFCLSPQVVPRFNQFIQEFDREASNETPMAAIIADADVQERDGWVMYYWASSTWDYPNHPTSHAASNIERWVASSIDEMDDLPGDPGDHYYMAVVGDEIDNLVSYGTGCHCNPFKMTLLRTVDFLGATAETDLKTALQEFIKDTEAVGIDSVKQMWPDLVHTYQKAVKAMAKAEGGI